MATPTPTPARFPGGGSKNAIDSGKLGSKPADPKRSPQRAAAELAKKKAEINKPAKGSVNFDKYKSGNFNGFTMKGPKG
jgi:hypothetical protein